MSYPNGLNITKCLSDVKVMFKNKIPEMIRIINNYLTPQYSTSIVSTFNTILNKVDLIDTNYNVTQIIFSLNTVNIQIAGLSVSPSTIYVITKALDDLKVIDSIYNIYDLSTYIPDLNRNDQFWTSLYQNYQTNSTLSAWYNNLTAPFANDTQKQIASMMAIEIPYGSDAQNE